jgi:hypothetical protein
VNEQQLAKEMILIRARVWDRATRWNGRVLVVSIAILVLCLVGSDCMSAGMGGNYHPAYTDSDGMWHPRVYGPIPQSIATGQGDSGGTR